jgi:hypothetical protein
MKYFWIWISVIGGVGLFANPTIKSKDSLQQGSAEVAPVKWDWSAMKIRFVGKAWPQTPEEGFSAVEKRAFTDGLAVAVQEVEKQHQQVMKSQQIPSSIAVQSAGQASKRMSRGAYTVHTEYFGDGSVRLSMESNLAAALFFSTLSFPIEKGASIQGIASTGVVLRSSSYIPPMSFYEVTDEGGQILFSVQQVAKDAYQKNLMGRWLTKSAGGKIDGLSRAVGKHPISIEIKSVVGNRFQVEGVKWKEALAQSWALLENAKIAVVTPPGSSSGTL